MNNKRTKQPPVVLLQKQLEEARREVAKTLAFEITGRGKRRVVNVDRACEQISEYEGKLQQMSKMQKLK